MSAAEIILLVAGIYTGIGAVFGVAFVVAGAARVDHAAAGAPWSFRLLIWPGAAALWPLMLAKWIRAARPGHTEPRP
jgi:hypothetical protein